jgi:hypothetical protein
MSKIKAADCVLAVYDVSRPQTIEGLADTWLPLVQDVSGDTATGKAVLVVGSKADLVESEDGAVQDDEARRVHELMAQFPFVLACYRCSAKHLDVDHVFYEAELSVSFPVAPLFDVATGTFTPRYRPIQARI